MNDGSNADGESRRDVFDVDEGRALEALRMMWGDAYDVAREDGRWTARRLDGRGGALEGETPDELSRQMRADRGIL